MHTSELPEGNRTPDTSIAHRADTEGRVVVNKDRNFRDIHLLRGSPSRLLMVATGNIANNAPLDLFDRRLHAIADAFAVHRSSSSAPIDSSSTVIDRTPAREPEK